VGVNENSIQIRSAKRDSKPIPYHCVGTYKFPNGMTYDLSGKIVNSLLKNSSLTNTPAMGLFIVKKK
jgi:hypothetical protein